MSHTNSRQSVSTNSPVAVAKTSITAAETVSTSAVSNIEIEENDEFQDACDSIEIPAYTMDLDTALGEAEMAVNYFFNNKFVEAKAILRPWSNYCMYHSVGNSVFSFLEAVLTFEQQHISEASESLKVCLEVCNRHRRKNTITEKVGKTFKRANYDQYTEMEIHAELCSAEALLLKALLTFIEDETLSSLIKGGIKIRNCFNSYKECATILSQRKWTSQSSKNHFESGVRMGMGTFNLMISLLPPRVIKLLEFIGFSGNKGSGLDDLVLGSNIPGIRQVLCSMTLLGYHLIVCYVLTHQEGDLDFCDTILEKQLELYPNGVWFLFFKARLEFMRGNLVEAESWYKRSWHSQTLWPQFHHLCFWELLWVNCLQTNWREASLYATYLVEASRWSRTTYMYQKASIMLMLGENLTSAERRTIENLMIEAPKFKQRIAGKSLPMEKFICRKVEKYFRQNKQLVLPAIELMYLWNAFKVMGKKYSIVDGIYEIVETTLTKLDEDQNKNSSFNLLYGDNKALCLLLKGACLRQMQSPMQGLQCLDEIIAMEKDIKEDTYLIPYAKVEKGLIYADEGQREFAVAVLEDAKKNHTGYSLESRLHFRIHTAISELKSKSSENIATLH